jgi:hypothetical protein
MLPWVEFAMNSSPYSVTGMTVLSQDGIRPHLAVERVALDRRGSGELSDWIEQQRGKVPQAEADGLPQVCRLQRPAKDKEEGVRGRLTLSSDERTTKRAVGGATACISRDPTTTWTTLGTTRRTSARRLGPVTVQVLDAFDAQEDAKEVQQRNAPRGDAAPGVR